MATTDNKTYLRNWHEISYNNMCLNATSSSDGNSINKNWFPYNKGGNFRKWYGNNEFVINYTNDGLDLLEMVRNKKDIILYERLNEFIVAKINLINKYVEELKAGTWTFKGFGDTKPVASNKTAKGRAQNRRTEVIHVGTINEGKL